MNRVIGYIRVSTETQAEAGYGLDTQREAIEKYCNDNNLQLEKIIDIDAGVSGTDEDREGLIDLFITLEETDIKKVIVMNTSRLWRDLDNKVLVTKQLMKMKVSIFSIEQPKYDMYSKDPQDFLYNSIIEIFDQYDRLITNLKLSKGRKTRGRKGLKPCGSAPLGYVWTTDKNIVIDKNESEIVTFIFKTYLEVKSLGRVKAALDYFNYKTKQGNNFSKVSINHILNNDFYIGIVTHAGIKSKGTHEPILTEYTFNKVKRLLDVKRQQQAAAIANRNKEETE